MEMVNDEGAQMGAGFQYWNRKCGLMEEENGRLESVIRRLEVEKAELTEEVRVMRRENAELAERMKQFVNRGEEKGGGGESLGLFRATAENETPESEKRTANDEVKDLKEEIMELRRRVAQLEEGGILTAKQTSCGGPKAKAVEGCIDLNMPDLRGAQRAPSSMKDGTPDLNTPYKSPVTTKSKGGTASSTRKLVYSREGVSNRRSLPISPAGVNSSGVEVITISDIDYEEDVSWKNPPIRTAVKSAPFGTCSDDDDEVFARRLSGRGSFKRQLTGKGSGSDGNMKSATPKRKRVSNVVAFDSESGHDDDIPISQLVRESLSKRAKHGLNGGGSGDEVDIDTIVNDDASWPSAPPRRRLIPLSQRRTKSTSNRSPTKYDSGVRSSEGVSGDGLEDTELESEGESLGGFIVNSSDSGSSKTNDCCSGGGDASYGSKLQSDSDVEYGNIMSKLRRDRDHHSKEWKLEGEMLAAFGKDPQLCMMAVCALYRRQTDDEKQCKGTIHANGRGFNQLDALGGSVLAEFLTDGNPYGPVNKSVEDLEKYCPNGVELCRNLASKYSKQLFTIYQNKEDPLFLPAGR